MNRCFLVGRLCADPVLKYTPGNGTAVTTFNLAVDRRFSKDDKKEADFIPIVIWGKIAESTAQYVSKGKLIAITGRIQTRSYEAKERGKRYITEVVAEEIKFIEWSKKNDTGYVACGGYEDMTPIEDGDIPF